MRVSLLKQEETNPRISSSSSATTIVAPVPPSPPEPFQPAEVELGKPGFFFGLEIPQQEHYFTTDQLTEKPVAATDINPDIALRLAGTSPRKAVLRLLINEDGSIDDVLIEQGDFSEEEAKLITDACKVLLFEPGKIHKTAVKVEMRIEMIIEAAGPVLPYAPKTP